jgi:hypothetical protein
MRLTELRFLSVIVGGMVFGLGTLLRVVLLQVVGGGLIALALFWRTLHAVRVGRIYMRAGSYIHRTRDPSAFWVQVAISAFATGVAIWVVAALMIGAVKFP